MRLILLLTAIFAMAAQADNFKVKHIYEVSADGHFANVLYLWVDNMTTNQETYIAIRCVGAAMETREDATKLPGMFSGSIELGDVALADDPSPFDTGEHCIEGVLKLNQALNIGSVYNPTSTPMLMAGNLKSEKAVKRASDISERLGGYYYSLNMHPEMWTWGED